MENLSKIHRLLIIADFQLPIVDLKMRRRVNSTVGPLDHAAMKRIIYSVVGGSFVMFGFGIGFLFGARQCFKWAMAWPALFLYRFFPPPAPDQIFPKLGSDTGILCTFAFATLTYSLIIYIVLTLLSKTRRRV